MGIAQILEFLGWLIFAAFKFAMVPPTMVLQGNSVLVVIFTTLLGAFLGVFAFYYGGRAIFQGLDKLLYRDKKRKVFTKGNRRIIRIKHRFGLVGICIFTVVFTIPVVSILLAKFYKHDKRAIPIFLSIIVAYTLLITFVSFFFQDILKPWFE